MRWLVCPICSGELDILVERSEQCAIDQEDRHLLDSVAPIVDVREVEINITCGALTCAVCRLYYPIYNGVPRMLTYASEVSRVHQRENAAWVAQHLSGFNLPSRQAPPGEEEVLRNFSTEWTEYKWSGQSYWSASPTMVLDWMRFALGTRQRPLQSKLALEVGIGIGGIADGLSKTENCEIVGIDLSYAVDQASRYFGKNPRLHIVQASVFALPFRRATFDVVYSQGVIHHTYSTKIAFSHLAQLPKENGMLYIWVYSHADESATPLRRTLMLIERTVRPFLSRLPRRIQTLALTPAVLPYIVYQNLIRRRNLGRDATTTYGWSEAMHAARDRLTPPFAHRHSYEEVAEWFRGQSYGHLEFLRDEDLPKGFDESFRRCVGIRGFLQT